MSPAVEIDGVVVDYGRRVRALDGITCTLAGGRIYGLLGRNGSGKTSLLSVLAGFRRPTAGTVRIGGHPVFERTDVVAQTCLIRGGGDTVDRDWPEDRVTDALRFASGLRPGWEPALADELVDRFDLPRRRRLGALSRGQRSALGVVLGLASRAPVTMLDESYLGMDAPSRYAFYDALLEDFMAHPRTIIISTHLIGEVAPLFEEVLVVDRGRLVLHDETDAVRARGAEVTGPTEAVDRFVDGLTVLSERQLGPTKSAVVYGLHGDASRSAAEAGLEVGPAALQDLFVHLTAPQTAAAEPQGSLP